jgi:ABC-2 type transport system permease protein
VEIDPNGNRALAESRLQDGTAVVGVVTVGDQIVALMDGTQLFAVQAAESALSHMAQAAKAEGATVPAITVQILYNPNLITSWIMIPGLTGLILLFIGTLITSLGIVRERQAGTIEQLAVMPFRPWDVIFGKIVPYLLLAALDLIAIVLIGMLLFGVPFIGSVATFAIGALLFLLVTLGMGVLVSTVSQNQGQAIQLAIMFVVPQILLSGLIFPVSSMARGVQWIAYVLPLKYFIDISRGVMLKATPFTALWVPLVVLGVMAVIVLGLAVLRFRRDLAPSARRRRPAKADSQARVA